MLLVEAELQAGWEKASFVWLETPWMAMAG